MRDNTHDRTLKNNYIQKYQHLIGEYELVKQKKHDIFKTAKAFYEAYDTCPQNFLKYYARYKASGGEDASLLPQKRGPKYSTRRPSTTIENMVLEQRDKGCNKYEIHSILKALLESKTPSPSGIYNILKRHGKNRLTKPMQEVKRRIIKEKAGELGHIDCHYLSKDMVMSDSRRRYLVGVIDSCTRVAWVEVVDDIKALTVMFATLRCFNHISQNYNVQFAEVLTDNGSEFGPKGSNKKASHPFERMLTELDVKHRYTRPYRPQTNGKIERFWRTLNDDLITGTYFESFDNFEDELLKYILYYNQLRPHQALGGKTPKDFAENCQRIT